jgi:hypothetical protein
VSQNLSPRRTHLKPQLAPSPRPAILPPTSLAQTFEFSLESSSRDCQLSRHLLPSLYCSFLSFVCIAPLFCSVPTPVPVVARISWTSRFLPKPSGPARALRALLTFPTLPPEGGENRRVAIFRFFPNRVEVYSAPSGRPGLLGLWHAESTIETVIQRLRTPMSSWISLLITSIT